MYQLATRAVTSTQVIGYDMTLMRYLMVLLCAWWWVIPPLTAQPGNQLPAVLPLGELVARVPIEASYLNIDNLDNAYLIRDRFGLVKVNADGKMVATYSTSAYGPLFTVDASNPLNVLLFYRDFNTIVTVDNELSEIGVHKLGFRGFTDIGAVGFAQDNNFWIFDNTTMQLKKINAAGNVLESSENLFTIGLPIEERPNFLLARNNLVFVNAPANGILVFDLMGGYYKRIPVTGLSAFQIIDNMLVYSQAGSFLLKMENLQLPREQSFLLPASETILMAKVGKERLFLLTPTELLIYALPR